MDTLEQARTELKRLKSFRYVWEEPAPDEYVIALLEEKLVSNITNLENKISKMEECLS
jgi:hypothetical protein